MGQIEHESIIRKYSNTLSRLADAERREKAIKARISKIILFILMFGLLGFLYHTTPRMRILTKIPRTALCLLNDVI